MESAVANNQGTLALCLSESVNALSAYSLNENVFLASKWACETDKIVELPGNC